MTDNFSASFGKSGTEKKISDIARALQQPRSIKVQYQTLSEDLEKLVQY
jgi:RNA-binding protein YhbY